MSDLEAKTVIAHALADLARPIALRYFRTQLDVENKDKTDFDPVTAADRDIEQAMRDYLGTHASEDGILGEEWGTREGSSGYRWVLDPIDGTRGFVTGTPTWGVLIALENTDGPVLGIMDQPFTGERFIGTGAGARWHHRGQSKTIQTSSVNSLAQATLLSTFPEIGTTAERMAFEAVRDHVQLTRYGLDCYGYALVAAGHADLVIESGLSEYDISAPTALVQAAGGVVTNWEGRPAHTGGRAIAASTPELHAEALSLLNAV